MRGFLVEMAGGRKPGTALDFGMGQGTGFDLAEKFLGAAKDYSLELLKALEPLTTKTFWNNRKTKKAAASTKAA